MERSKPLDHSTFPGVVGAELRGAAAIAFGSSPGSSRKSRWPHWCCSSVSTPWPTRTRHLDGPFGRREHDHWWLLLLRGVVGVAAGSLAFVAPGITALALLFYIAVWALATGVLEIALAIRLRKEIQGEWLLILAGLAAVLFGYFLLARPGEGALALLRTIAVFSVFFGGIFVLLGFKMRRFVKRMTPR